MEETIVGLDIGSTAIRVAVGQKVHSEESKIPKLHIVGVIEVPSEGVNRGVVKNIDDAVKAVSKALDRAEKVTGLPIESAWVSISGSNVGSQSSRGIVAVSKTDGEIREEDVERAIDAAKTVTTPPNYEILHVVSRNFSVDGQDGVNNPVGMNGMRLEVDAYIIETMSSEVNNLTKSIYLAGLDIEDIVFNPLACSEATLTNKQRDVGVAVVNIGSSTTSLAVYEEGDLLHIAVLPIGSEYITQDIAIGLRTSLDLAEEIKLKFGSAVSKGISKREEINLADLDESEDSVVSRKYICEIIEARVEEIFDKIDAELKKIDRSGTLPAGVVLCGGGSKLADITDVAKSTLRLPVALGYPVDVTSVIDKVNDLSMITAIGLVKWGEKVGSDGGFASKFKSINNVTDKMRKWFKSLMP